MPRTSRTYEKYDQSDTISKDMEEFKQERHTLRSELCLYNRKERKAVIAAEENSGGKSKPVSASELSTYSLDESDVFATSPRSTQTSQTDAHMLHNLAPPLVRLLVAMSHNQLQSVTEPEENEDREQNLISGLLTHQN